MDAISAWWFHGPTIDGLPRALWYTPQHGASCALGLVAILIAAAGGAALAFSLAPLGRINSLIVVALALGPLLAVALTGAWLERRQRALGPALVALVLGLICFLTVSLAGTDPVWVGWRAGNLMLVTLPALAAAALTRIGAISRRAVRIAALAVVGLLLLGGGVTTVADWFNAQDVENAWPGPGFKWTLALSPAQHAAFDWIRANAPRRAVVQMEPIARGRDGWTNVPAFSQRVMAAGLPISLVLQPYHRERSERVRRLYAVEDAKAAWAEARAMRIDYLYLDAVDRAAQTEGAIAKFDLAPDLFQPVFAQDDVRVYAVTR